jgi:hypothetical protein
LATSGIRVRRRDDLDRDLHGEMVGRGPDPRALQRDRLARLAHDRNPHEVLIPDNAARWIEVHPAWSGNIDLNPGMCISARETIVIIVIGKT